MSTPPSQDSGPSPKRQQTSPPSTYIPLDLVLLDLASSALDAYKSLVLDPDSHEFLLTDAPHTQLQVLPLQNTAPADLPVQVQVLVNTLPVLDNLATQILRTIASRSTQEMVDLAASRDVGEGLVLRRLMETLYLVVQLYHPDDADPPQGPFLLVGSVIPGLWEPQSPLPHSLKGREAAMEGAVRKSNLALFLAAVLGLVDMGFYWLNELFLDVFCPSHQVGANSGLHSHYTIRFVKTHGILFMELKTQAYISALGETQGEDAVARLREDILEDAFPSTLEALLLLRRSGATLTDLEEWFLEQCENRRRSLLEARDDEDLGEKYLWLGFLTELLDYVNRNMGLLIHGKRVRQWHDAPGFKREPPRLAASAPAPYRPLSRRAWLAAEEAALVDGLKRYGPSWTMIHKLHGPGGKNLEALKDRSQVQLKDKARNMRISFLKSNDPLPDYLKEVTGDLLRDERLRKQAAEHRERLQQLLQGSEAASASKTSVEREADYGDKEESAANQGIEMELQRIVESVMQDSAS